jgi:hypothetical protein
MKRYKFIFTGGFLNLLLIVFMSLSVVGIPLAIMMMLGMYEIVEVGHSRFGNE